MHYLSDIHPRDTRSGGGYVDAHVHLRDAAGLDDLRKAGVVAVRDAGTQDGAGLKIAASEPPAVVSAGRALCKQGGYGARFGTAVGTRRELRAEILKLKAAGAGIVKVMASGIVSMKEPGRITPGGFGLDELKFIVDEAGRHGLGVMAHANGEAAIMNAVAAGVRSIEHGFFMSKAALQSILRRRVFWVPTVGALRRAAEQLDISSEPAVFIDTEIERHLAMIGRAFRLGVPLAVGTDCVLPDRRYGGAFRDELTFFRGAGIPADVVERIACEGGAKLLGI